MVFCSFDSIYAEDLRSKIFLVLVKIRRDRLTFMSLGVLGEYGKIFFGVFVICAFRIFSELYAKRMENTQKEIFTFSNV
jgi:hypothetical protein